jgi:hypothetical protein
VATQLVDRVPTRRDRDRTCADRLAALDVERTVTDHIDLRGAFARGGARRALSIRDPWSTQNAPPLAKKRSRP